MLYVCMGGSLTEELDSMRKAPDGSSKWHWVSRLTSANQNTFTATFAGREGPHHPGVYAFLYITPGPGGDLKYIVLGHRYILSQTQQGGYRSCALTC